MLRTPFKLCLLLVTAGIALAGTSSASSMGAFVQRGDAFCFFAPGDIPGVNVFFETRGQVVITPSGQFHLTCHGDLPAGYSVSRAVQIDLPCESPGFPNARGQIVVTPSGRVNAVCQASL